MLQEATVTVLQDIPVNNDTDININDNNEQQEHQPQDHIDDDEHQRQQEHQAVAAGRPSSRRSLLWYLQDPSTIRRFMLFTRFMHDMVHIVTSSAFDNFKKVERFILQHVSSGQVKLRIVFMFVFMCLSMCAFKSGTSNPQPYLFKHSDFQLGPSSVGRTPYLNINYIHNFNMHSSASSIIEQQPLQGLLQPEDPQDVVGDIDFKGVKADEKFKPFHVFSTSSDRLMMRTFIQVTT